MIYVVSQLILVFRTLDDRWPLGDIVFGTAFFTIAQVLLFAFSVTICDAIKHYIDGLFFFTLCMLLSVMMVYKYWDSITVSCDVFVRSLLSLDVHCLSARILSSLSAPKPPYGKSRIHYLLVLEVPTMKKTPQVIITVARLRVWSVVSVVSNYIRKVASISVHIHHLLDLGIDLGFYCIGQLLSSFPPFSNLDVHFASLMPSHEPFNM